MGPVTRRSKILVVEDDPNLRYQYRSVLTLEGFAVDAVADGLDALQHLELEDLPDLVVLDLGLISVSGRSVQEDIAARARTRHIPVLVVTGDPGDLAESELVCILTKPVETEALIATVHRCLTKKRAAG
jgi:two-component system cell cycle response regulator DivK